MPAMVRSGEQGFDSSFSHPPLPRMVELGYTFRVGYISVAPAASGKNITPAECAETIAAAVKLLLVWEMSATRPNLGAAFGQVDGTAAVVEAEKRGYPHDCPIIIACDTNTTTANVDRHEQYVRAFATACLPYSVGIYGDIDILTRTAGLWQVGWLPSAWSWSGATKAQAEQRARAIGVHVLQHTGFYVDGVWAVDPNTAIADFPAWGSAPPTPPPDPPTEDDMAVATFEVEGLPGIYMWGPGMPAPVPFTNPADFTQLSAALAAGSAGKISRAMYDRLFTPAPTVTIPPITIPPVTVTLPPSITSTSTTKWTTP